jgi:stearoyl-CoA desaturase (Delta-9 desaturase)
VFPSNEVEKGALTMKLKALKTIQDSLVWTCSSRDLPVVTWERCKTSLKLLKRAFTNHTLSVREGSKSRSVILVSGFIRDVSNFIEQHPGGGALRPAMEATEAGSKRRCEGEEVSIFVSAVVESTI